MSGDARGIGAPARTSPGRLVLVLAVGSLSACPGGSVEVAPPGGSTGSSTGATPGTTGPDEAGTTTPGLDSGETAEDGLPPAPTLLSPSDGALDVPRQTALCWNPVEDPEGAPIRYRVFVDDLELTPGKPGDDPGVVGPCIGPLVFDHEQTYQWQLQAFEQSDPSRQSPRSETWSFTVVGDGQTQTVFEDRFDTDLGWEIGGDARSGAWVRDDPTPATHQGMRSQPGDCLGGTHCYFTGHNPGGAPDDEDVSGGSTTLTSPPFDLGGAATATVQLWRFFYESAPEALPGLRVELLVPDPRAPGGIATYGLERLEKSTVEIPENRWTPREYAACGLPMVDGSRLRIVATDAGPGILEAAIDSVSVHAHSGTAVCGAGEGGRCDPAQGAAACPGTLQCCGQGPLNSGVHRCRAPVAGLDFGAPPPEPDAPSHGPLGCPGPDLLIDPWWIEPVLTDIFVHEGTCELYEGCVGGLGWRTILRFTITAANVGSDDLVLGVAANEPDLFHYAECHDHYHFDRFARFELRDQGGVVAASYKPGFCLLDSYSWAWPNTPGKYDCANQGISRGHADIYEADLPCQWIDVTDVPPGDYTLWAELNVRRDDTAVPLLRERDYGNNTAEVAVTLP